MNYELNGATVERETAKAILVNVEIDTQCGRKGKDIWFPKSQTEVEDGHVFCTAWILNAKANDIQTPGFVGFICTKLN